MNILLRRRKLGNGSCRGIEAASTTGLKMFRNDGQWPQDVHYVFRWGCTTNVPQGTTVVNSAESIHWCSDKRRGRLEMQAAGVSVPETYATHEFVRLNPAHYPGYEWVMRRQHHAQGRDLWAGTYAHVMDVLRNQVVDGYVSRLINKVAEYRVAVICNSIAWVARKTPGNPDQVAWNVAQGGRFDNVRWDDWPIEVCKEALKAAKVSGTDFCGVDVMVDADGKPYVLEVNSAPSQTSAYRQGCFARCFDYIVQNGKEHFPDPERIKTYKSMIHPAVRNKDE